MIIVRAFTLPLESGSALRVGYIMTKLSIIFYVVVVVVVVVYLFVCFLFLSLFVPLIY